MSVEASKAAVRRYIEEVLNNKRFELIDELVAADFVAHHRHPGAPSGRDGVRQAVAMNPPDYHATIEDLLADGDRVIVRVTEHATIEDTFRGIPAAGKRITGSWIAIYRVRNGQLAERWYEADLLHLFNQIGMVLVPAPDTAARNTAVVRRYIEEANNGGNIALVDELVTAHYFSHGFGPRTSDELKRFLAWQRASAPDWHITIEEIVAEADNVVVRATANGTRTEESPGVPFPSPQYQEIAWIAIYRLEQGRIAEVRTARSR